MSERRPATYEVRDRAGKECLPPQTLAELSLLGRVVWGEDSYGAEGCIVAAGKGRNLYCVTAVFDGEEYA